MHARLQLSSALPKESNSTSWGVLLPPYILNAGVVADSRRTQSGSSEKLTQQLRVQGCKITAPQEWEVKDQVSCHIDKVWRPASNHAVNLRSLHTQRLR